MQPAIQLSQVNKRFVRSHGDIVHSLKDIDLTIETGEIVSVVGTNGAGKSTLFNALTGQIKIDSGEIKINGKRVNQLPPVERAGLIGRVFQNPEQGTAPRMTVFENLMLASKRGQRRGFSQSLTPINYKEMQTYLTPYGLNIEDRLDIPISNLSGGQRQIVSLLMATLKRPNLLLLDEHTASLDPRTARQVMATTIDMVEQQNLTTLMITHQLQDAVQYSDRIILMHQGQIHLIYESDEVSQMDSTSLYQALVERNEVSNKV